MNIELPNSLLKQARAEGRIRAEEEE